MSVWTSICVEGSARRSRCLEHKKKALCPVVSPYAGLAVVHCGSCDLVESYASKFLRNTRGREAKFEFWEREDSEPVHEANPHQVHR